MAKAVLGFYNSPEDLIAGMEKVRAANYEQFDAYTPFPVHGLDDAQGLKRSWIPWAVLVLGMSGTATAFVMQYWMSAVDWPHIIGGKPFNSWPAFVPIMFELTVLFAGITNLVSMLVACGFPNLKKKIFDPSLTNNRFAIAIEEVVLPTHDSHGDVIERKPSKFKTFNESEASQLLKQSGAVEVRTVVQEGWFA